MSKFKLVAFAEQKLPLLKSLQSFKEVEIDYIELDEPKEGVETTIENKTATGLELLERANNNEELTRIDERLNTVHTALKLLKKYHTADKSLKVMMAGNKTYTFDELSTMAAEYDWKGVAYALKD